MEAVLVLKIITLTLTYYTFLILSHGCLRLFLFALPFPFPLLAHHEKILPVKFSVLVLVQFLLSSYESFLSFLFRWHGFWHDVCSWLVYVFRLAAFIVLASS